MLGSASKYLSTLPLLTHLRDQHSVVLEGKDLILESVALRQQVLVMHIKRPRRRTQSVLGHVEQVVVWMEKTPRPRSGPPRPYPETAWLLSEYC